MKSGAFIPKDLIITVNESVGTKQLPCGTFEYVMKERQARILFCDVLVFGDRITIDQYYDDNHAVAKEITEIELHTIDGFENFQEGESAEIYRKVFRY